MYALAYVVYEPFALPILLLSGISTGWRAICCQPHRAQLLVIGMIIITSVAVPFCCHLLSMHLLTRSLKYLFINDILAFYCTVHSTLLGWLTKKYFPAGSKFADKNSFHLSLIFIALINWGMFAKFAGFFIQNRCSCSKLWQQHSLLCCLLYSRVCRNYR